MTDETRKKKRTIVVTRALLVILLAAGMLLSAAGYLDNIVRFCGMGHVADANEIYLKNSFDNAVNGFMVLSAVKSGLAIIEGSSVGIGFNLELGDVVQSVYDYVDVAWKTALAGGTILLLTRLVLEAVVLCDHWCLTLLFGSVMVFFAASWAVPGRRRIVQVCRELATVLAVLCAALYFILPLSITAASLLSKRISQPLVQDAYEDFSGIRSLFSSERLARDLFPDNQAEGDSWHSGLGSLANFDVMRKRLKAAAERFSEQTRDIAVWTMKLVAGYLFDCILFPAAFFLILLLFTRGMLAHLIGSHRQARFREDLETLLASTPHPTQPPAR